MIHMHTRTYIYIVYVGMGNPIGDGDINNRKLGMHLRTQKPQARTTLHSLAIALDFAEFCYSALTSFLTDLSLFKNSSTACYFTLLNYPYCPSRCFVSFILIMYTIWHID